MDENTLKQFDLIEARIRDIIYSVKKPEHMLFDLDSTLLATSGKQEGEGFNFHYQAHGYHPIICYDGLTGDLLKTELRDGTQYCSKDADKFILPLLREFRTKHPSMPLYLRGDSGFDFSAVSSHSRVANANRLRVHALAYNLFNWFRRLALATSMRRMRIDAIRLKLLKVAAKVVRSARYITFNLLR